MAFQDELRLGKTGRCDPNRLQVSREMMRRMTCAANGKCWHCGGALGEVKTDAKIPRCARCKDKDRRWHNARKRIAAIKAIAKSREKAKGT